jgi:ribosomal protein S17
MEIHKKAWPELFQKVLEGKKKFDIRLADFDVKEGDVLILEEYNPKTKEYTGRSIKKKVSFVMKWNPLNVHSSEEIKKQGLLGIGLE